MGRQRTRVRVACLALRLDKVDALLALLARLGRWIERIERVERLGLEAHERVALPGAARVEADDVVVRRQTGGVASEIAGEADAACTRAAGIDEQVALRSPCRGESRDGERRRAGTGLVVVSGHVNSPAVRARARHSAWTPCNGLVVRIVHARERRATRRR